MNIDYFMQQLSDANKMGLNPPQDWIRRTIEAIKQLRQLRTELEQANQRIAELENPWISVEDELPDEGLFVALYASSGGIGYGFHDGDEWVLYGPMSLIGEITYWFEIPPKESDK